MERTDAMHPKIQQFLETRVSEDGSQPFELGGKARWWWIWEHIVWNHSTGNYPAENVQPGLRLRHIGLVSGHGCNWPTQTINSSWPAWFSHGKKKKSTLKMKKEHWHAVRSRWHKQRPHPPAKKVQTRDSHLNTVLIPGAEKKSYELSQGGFHWRGGWRDEGWTVGTTDGPDQAAHPAPQSGQSCGGTGETLFDVFLRSNLWHAVQGNPPVMEQKRRIGHRIRAGRAAGKSSVSDPERLGFGQIAKAVCLVIFSRSLSNVNQRKGHRVLELWSRESGVIRSTNPNGKWSAPLCASVEFSFIFLPHISRLKTDFLFGMFLSGLIWPVWESFWLGSFKQVNAV